VYAAWSLLVAVGNMKMMHAFSKFLLAAALVAGTVAACGRSGIPVPDSSSTGGSSPSSSGGSVGTGGAASTGGAGGHSVDAGTLPACSTLSSPPTVDLCVQPVGGWQDGTIYDTKRSVQLSGTITAVATGPVTGGCFQSAASSGSEIVALAVRTQADGGTTDWNVEYQVPANNVVWTVGEHIDVAYTASGGGWSPVISSLTLNFGQAVDVYIGVGGDVADLRDVPLTFRQGSAICLENDECGERGRKEAGGHPRVDAGEEGRDRDRGRRADRPGGIEGAGRNLRGHLEISSRSSILTRLR